MIRLNGSYLLMDWDLNCVMFLFKLMICQRKPSFIRCHRLQKRRFFSGLRYCL